MKLAIMQPYFFPYIGYHQLIGAVDQFIIYDNIKYTKKGWVNRNRMLRNGTDATFSLPIKKGSDFDNVCERQVADTFSADKFLAQLRGAYQKAPFFKPTIAFVERALSAPDPNLYTFLHHSINETINYLGLDTKVLTSSEVDIDHDLAGQNKVIALCKAVGATTYVNPIGGQDLYARETFAENGISLKFLKPALIEYTQFDAPFVPWLSIIDVLMFNALEDVRDRFLPGYELV